MANNVERVIELTADIICDILSILPVKTLIRFKAVCKTWYAGMENPIFVKAHKKMQPSIGLEPTYDKMIVTANGSGNAKKCSLFCFSEASRKIIDTELSYLPRLKDSVVVGICNGLVCLSASINSQELIICNPTTRQFRQTPTFKLQNYGYDLIFLGFCLHVNGYQIIRILYAPTHISNEVDIRAELYTMSTYTWTEIEVKLGWDFWLWKLDNREDDNLEAVIVSGVFYWKAQCSQGDPYVVSFDNDKDVFDVIEAPGAHAAIGWQLHEIKEKLALIVYQDYTMFDLWVLYDNYFWNRIQIIDFSMTPRYPANRVGKIRVFGSTRNGELILVRWYEGNLKLLLFDLNSKETKYLHDIDFEGVIVDAFLYTESLTPVK